jgi:short-subunit dehydrogenase
MGYFKGKSAAITGAGSGIGRALAQRLAADGCTLFLADVDAQGLAQTKASVFDATRCATSLVDVADSGQVRRWAAEVGGETGHLDLLVNNAGVGLIGDAATTPLEDFHWLMNINFWGVVHGCQAFLPLLEASPRGHLVNISSIFGIIAVPTQAAYNASKFAVKGYTEALRQDLEIAGSSVHVCCVHPGGVGTNIARRARNTDPAISGDEQQARFEEFVRTSAEEAAEAILTAAERGRKRLLLGPDAHFIDWVHRLFPTRYPRFFQKHLIQARPEP